MKKIFVEIFLWKEKFSQKKNSIIKIFTKEKLVEKNFRKKIFRNFFFFIFEKKFGLNSVNFQKKFGNNFCNFFIFEKKIR